VDNLKAYQKMGDPFQGIDDGLGGKVLPALPKLGEGASGDRRQLIWPCKGAISDVTEVCAKMDISGVKALTARAASQLFLSPTSTLKPLMQDSPTAPALIISNPCGYLWFCVLHEPVVVL
jgi:hypothetical protein